jgi:DNA-binding NarL/FixJ family response regulator
MTAHPSLLVLSTDLMSSVRIADTATALGFESTTAESATAIEDASADIVVIDIASSPISPADAVQQLRRSNPAARFIAVYRHTDPDQARAARAAGCDLVINRAQFFGDIAAALRPK